MGYYFSRAANSWVTAPSCYPRWGNLSASPPQVVPAGQPVTVAAIPDTMISPMANQTDAPDGADAGWRAAGHPI